MSNPRASIDTSGQGASQNYFAWFGDSADPTVWMREDEHVELGAIEELISSGELSLSVGH